MIRETATRVILTAAAAREVIGMTPEGGGAEGEMGRGLHSSTFQLNLCRFCLKITLLTTTDTPLYPATPPALTLINPSIHPCPTESADVEPKSGRV